MAAKDLPIGVFDSGIGGMTVVAALRKKLPREEIVFLGDTARLPYGTKSADTIVKYAKMCAGYLAQKNIKMLVVACNTVSAYALEALSAALPIPVIGVIEPAVERALQAAGGARFGVLGTRATASSGIYQKVARSKNERSAVSAQACPLFVPLAEEGMADAPETASIAERYLGELKEKDPEIVKIVLGCTHYPILKKAIADAAKKAFGREVELIDSATAVAEAAARLLREKDILRTEGEGGLSCFVTDQSRIAELARLFGGEDGAASCARVDIG